MDKRKTSKKLECLLGGEDIQDSELIELKKVADQISDVARQYQPAEKSKSVIRARVQREIYKHENSVTFRERARFKQQTTLRPQRRFAMSWIFVAITLLALTGGTGAVYASGDALPGDVLYPVKIAAEDIQLLVSDDEGDVDLLLEFMDERLDEVDELLDEENLDGVELALDSYQNHMEQLTTLMTKVQPDEAVAGDALQAEVQSRLEEQAQRMVNINEDAGERLQIQEQTQDRLETQDQLKSGADETDAVDEEISNGDQNEDAGQQNNSQQSEPQNQQQNQGLTSLSVHTYNFSQDDQLTLRFMVNGNQQGNLYVKVNGIQYACSSTQAELVCQGPVTTEDDFLVEVIDSETGTVVFSQWMTGRGNSSSGTSSGSGNVDGQGGSGGKGH